MIAELLGTFNSTLKFMEQSVADLSEQQMVQQPTGVPNHAAWILGHTVYSCQGIAEMLGVQGWLPDEWTALFGTGSTPTAVLSRYPTKSDLVATLTQAADRLRHALLATDEASLAEPLPDEGCREIMPTVGHALLQVIAAHNAFHAGQLAVWRRAVGLPSAAVFV